MVVIHSYAYAPAARPVPGRRFRQKGLVFGDQGLGTSKADGKMLTAVRNTPVVAEEVVWSASALSSI
jgi:hypothetical protein